MTDALKRLIDTARLAPMSPEEREAQRRSFAYGNTHFENPDITREMVDREAEKLKVAASDERDEPTVWAALDA